MTDYEAFILKICTDPADDTPRLVFADWLAENGEPERAEFIRVQYALSRLDQFTAMPHWHDRVMTLCRSEWFTPERRSAYLHRDGVYGNLEIQCLVDGRDSLALVVRRGFVDEVQCTFDVFMEHVEMLFRQHPITRVVLTDREPHEISRGTWWTAIKRIATWRREDASNNYSALYALCSSQDIALDTQSSACVTYGRWFAGLPPLKQPDTPKVAEYPKADFTPRFILEQQEPLSEGSDS